jgi:glutathione S-transferase
MPTTFTLIAYRPRSFYELSPSGGIPVAIIKGRVMSESNDIMQVNTTTTVI